MNCVDAMTYLVLLQGLATARVQEPTQYGYIMICHGS